MLSTHVWDDVINVEHIFNIEVLRLKSTFCSITFHCRPILTENVQDISYIDDAYSVILSMATY